MRLTKLFEDPKLEKAKANILDQIAGIDVTDENQIKLLDKIFRVLNSEQSNTTITAAFGPATADEEWSDKARQQHILNVAKIIHDVDTNYDSLMTFLKKLEQGNVLDVSVFGKKESNFNELLYADPVAIKVFESLQMYGKGQKRAGAGEFALAMLSPKIKMAPGEGDLVVNGVSTELKTETTAGGGRMGSGGPNRSDQIKVLQKYAEHIPELIEMFPDGSRGKSMLVGPFVDLLDKVLPVGGQSPAGGNNTQIRQALATDMMRLTFGDPYASAIGKTFGQPNKQLILNAMIVQNYEWYKARDSFELFVVLSFKSSRLTMIQNGQDMADAFANGSLNGGVGAFIHTGQASEVFGQMKSPKI
jgi:hypothetical protein